MSLEGCKGVGTGAKAIVTEAEMRCLLKGLVENMICISGKRSRQRPPGQWKLVPKSGLRSDLKS